MSESNSKSLVARGLMLGKFMPPHEGHLFVARTGINMVDQMTVLVCSTDDEPMPGDLRFRWMKECLPQAAVLHLHRNLPQEPADHPDFWSIWQEVIRKMHPEPIDHVFGSDSYIFQLAEVLEATPVLIDPDREVFPVSGTAIRETPLSQWAYLPPVVQAHYMKRVCVLGPESTGKSILANTLAERYETTVMPEYGRTYDEQYKQTKTDPREWQIVDLVTLARTHRAMRKALMPHANKVLIEDTDVIQTVIWEYHLIGCNSPKMLKLLDESDLADFYLILAPTVPFTNDGGRYFKDLPTRQKFFSHAIKILSVHSIPYVIIDENDWQQREAAAFMAVEKFLEF